MEQLTPSLQKKIPDELDLAFGDIRYDYHIDRLTPAEQQEYNSFGNDQRKAEFLSTRVLLKNLGMKIGLDPSHFEIRKDDWGKPYGIYDRHRFFISIAHSREKIVCGISKTAELGIDLEPVGRTVSDRLRKRILHPQEDQLINKMELIRLWTIKEALVKLGGHGLRTNLNELRISRDTTTDFSAFFNNDKTARICSFDHQNYWIALAHYR